LSSSAWTRKRLRNGGRFSFRGCFLSFWQCFAAPAATLAAEYCFLREKRAFAIRADAVPASTPRLPPQKPAGTEIPDSRPHGSTHHRCPAASGSNAQTADASCPTSALHPAPTTRSGICWRSVLVSNGDKAHALSAHTKLPPAGDARWSRSPGWDAYAFSSAGRLSLPARLPPLMPSVTLCALLW